MSFEDSNENKKRKYSAGFLDLKAYDTTKLTLELRKSQNESLLWLLSELDIQFNNIAEKEIKRDNIVDFRNFATQVIPFFKKHLKNKNKNISFLCQKGLDLVYKRFPNLNES